MSKYLSPIETRSSSFTTQDLGTSTTTETVTWDLSQGMSASLIVNGPGEVTTLAVSNEPTESYMVDIFYRLISIYKTPRGCD